MHLGAAQLQLNPDQFQGTIETIKEDDIATIVYTSGTTGEPKGAVITHKALCQVLLNVKKFSLNAFHKEDRLLTFLPLSHVLGRCESFFPIIFGCQAVYAESINKLIPNISVVKPTLMVAVPRIFEKIYEKTMSTLDENFIKRSLFDWANKSANDYFEAIDSDKTPRSKTIVEYQLAKKLVFQKIYDLFGGRIRYFISGGAPLSPKIIQFLRNTNLTVLEGYGLTETVAPCFVNPMNKQIPGTVGQPIGDVEIKFRDDGEILIKSEAMFSEYFKNPKATEEAIDQDGWFATGDIGEFNDKGFLRITDRKKDILITSGGKNIAPQHLENTLKLSALISQPVIIGDGRKYLTALIGIESEVLEPYFEQLEISDQCDTKALANHTGIIELIEKEIAKINLELASFETIKKFKILPIELNQDNYITPSMKIKRKLIHKDFEKLIDAMY
jgi:long-chain acyl-CoA synthetase